jgi:HD-like signal output (HDOD) protein
LSKRDELDRYQDILKNVVDFPTLPTIYSALLEKMSDPNSTIDEIAKIIATDPASTTKILKTVNSSLFSLQRRIDTISEAIFHVGFNEVKNLLMAMAVMDIFSSAIPIQSLSFVDLWKHSIGVGVVARLIGKSLGIKNIENYYLAGMLHDLGKLFLIRCYPNEYERAVSIVYERGINIEYAEKEVFKITHSDAGKLLADKWNLPSSISNSILYHEDGTINGEFDNQVACIHMANIVVHVLQFGCSGRNLIPQPNIAAFEPLDLPNDFFSSSRDEIITSYNQSVNIFIL